MKITDFMRIFSSERRIEVLDALMRQETKDEIKKHIPSSTYAFTVNYLKKVGFVREADGEVSLTDRGYANLVVFERFKESINTSGYSMKPFRTIPSLSRTSSLFASVRSGMPRLSSLNHPIS